MDAETLRMIFHYLIVGLSIYFLYRVSTLSSKPLPEDSEREDVDDLIDELFEDDTPTLVGYCATCGEAIYSDETYVSLPFFFEIKHVACPKEMN